ncbi:MAG: hypothetical protein ACOC9W_04125, partial [Persicimonas sp.]
WMLAVASALTVVAVSVTVHAQDDDERPDMRAKIVIDEANGAQFTRPEGWVSGEAGKGVAAVFRAAGDRETQIEIRVSPHVKPDQSDYFFTSFHSNLQKAGFEKQEVRKDADYGDKKGLETEYETSSKKRKFRLIVWQYHHDESAFIVVGFFPSDARERYYPDFQEIIEQMVLE